MNLQWQSNLSRHPESNFAQSELWDEVQSRLGAKTFADVRESGATTLMIERDARRGRYLEIPCGPVLDWKKPAQVNAAFATIKSTAEQAGAIFVRFRPQLDDTPENQALLATAAEKVGLKLRPAKMHLAAEHTVLLDLTKSEADLLAAMRRQTRYDVRRAAKLGITVERRTDDAIFKEFHKIQKQTAERQHFIPPDFATLEAIHATFGDHAPIYVARTSEGKAIAYGLILETAQEADYYEAASTSLNQKLPGAHALIWQVARDAKAAGIPRLNLWGIAPPHQPHHRYAGVTTFKTGFGGEVKNFIPAQDLIISPLQYLPNYLIETIRKKVRHL